jgi:arylsulfatase A-like enzyme
VRRRALTALVAATSLVACHDGPGGQQGAPPPSASAASPSGSPAAATAAPASLAVPPKPAGPPGPLNVILLTIDSMRADMPWAGYARPIAPNLTKLAAESVVYTHAYSVSSYTAKSVGAFSTGRYPSTLYRSGYFFTDYSKADLFLAEVLHDHGIRTIGVHSHLYFGKGKGLEQGFDVWELVPGITFDPETDKNVTSDKMTDLGIRLLGDPANTGHPFFAWLHYVDPHDQYVKHAESPDFGKTNRDRYDSEIYFTDYHVGRLLEWCKGQPWWPRTAVIVSADHGEAFGEHGVYKHAFWLWDVLTHVPLMVHAPGAKPLTIDMNRSQVDLAPTILDLMGVREVPESFVGRTLVPEVYGEQAPDDRDPIVLDLPEDSHNPDVKAIIQGTSKLIVYGETKRRELYDLASDPGELHDLSKTDPEKLASMNAEFERTWASIPVVAPYGGAKLRQGGIAKGPMGPASKP